MLGPLDKIANSFYVDAVGNTFFCVADFLRENQLRDSPELRLVVVEEIREIFPGVLILEEWQ
jgi:hypothetical protein